LSLSLLMVLLDAMQKGRLKTKIGFQTTFFFTIVD